MRARSLPRPAAGARRPRSPSSADDTRHVRNPPARPVRGGRLDGMELDFERCYRAVDSRDQRFDGWFFTAVTTTGIYCRPSCPAITPKREQRQLLSQRGRRPAGRLPGLPALPAGRRARLAGVGRPRRRGRPGDAADRRRRGGPRRRAGAGRPARLHRAAPAPDAHRRTRRRPARAGPGAARADRADPHRDHRPRPRRDRVRGRVSAACGSSTTRSARCTRSAPRRAAASAGRPRRTGAGTIGLRLRVPGAAARAGAARLPGGAGAARASRRWTADTYRRTSEAAARQRDGRADPGRPLGRRPTLRLDRRARPRARGGPLPPAVRPGRRPGRRRRARWARTPRWPRRSTEPGVRVPRAVDGFEMAVRAVVGQQVSVPAARTTLGPHDPATAGGGPGFPTADAVAELPDEAFGMPAARRATIRALAAGGRGRQAATSSRAPTGTEAVARLLELPGVGAVDRRLRGDARDRRPGRVPADRPRGPPRRRGARPARRPQGAGRGTPNAGGRGARTP